MLCHLSVSRKSCVLTVLVALVLTLLLSAVDAGGRIAIARSNDDDPNDTIVVYAIG